MRYWLTFVESVLSNLFHDIRSDTNPLIGDRPPVIWINGLAKSGTSLVENIVREAGYVDGSRSLLRPRIHCPSLNDGLMDVKIIAMQPRNKLTYVKTHCIRNEIAERCASLDYSKQIIVVRDVRDALVSRFFHILSDPTHWIHEACPPLRADLESFKRATLQINPVTNLNSLEYFVDWVASWDFSVFADRIVRYEDYKTDSAKFIQRVYDILSIPSAQADIVEERLQAARNRAKGLNNLAQRRAALSGQSATFRRGEVGEYVDWFDTELLEKFDKCVTTKKRLYANEN